MTTIDFIIKCLFSFLDGLSWGIEALWQSMCQIVTGVIQSGNPLCIVLLIAVIVSIFIPVKKFRR